MVLTSLYSNYLLALGYGRRLFALEVAKDLLILAAILSTVWFGSVPLLVWGQLAASVVTYVVSLLILRRAAGFSVRAMVRDLLPSMAIAGVSCLVVAVALYAAGLSGVVVFPVGKHGWTDSIGRRSSVRHRVIPSSVPPCTSP